MPPLSIHFVSNTWIIDGYINLEIGLRNGGLSASLGLPHYYPESWYTVKIYVDHHMASHPSVYHLVRPWLITSSIQRSNLSHSLGLALFIQYRNRVSIEPVWNGLIRLILSILDRNGRKGPYELHSYVTVVGKFFNSRFTPWPCIVVVFWFKLCLIWASVVWIEVYRDYMAVVCMLYSLLW